MIEVGKYIYHMSHYKNLPGIMQHGILSHTLAQQLGVTAVDISDPAVQVRRHVFTESVYHRQIHDYAPFYLNPRNPMLYVRRNIQHELVVICVATDILEDHQYVFADGNAASSGTRFGTDASVLKTCANVLGATRWNVFPDGKRKRCAEVLVFPKAEPVHIQRFVCHNRLIGQYVARVTDRETVIDLSFYF